MTITESDIEFFLMTVYCCLSCKLHPWSRLGFIKSWKNVWLGAGADMKSRARFETQNCEYFTILQVGSDTSEMVLSWCFWRRRNSCQDFSMLVERGASDVLGDVNPANYGIYCVVRSEPEKLTRSMWNGYIFSDIHPGVGPLTLTLNYLGRRRKKEKESEMLACRGTAWLPL